MAGTVGVCVSEVVRLFGKRGVVAAEITASGRGAKKKSVFGCLRKEKLSKLWVENWMK